MKTSIATLALLLSSLSLALQIKKSNPISPFDKFMVPAKISELDYHAVRANQDMIKGYVDIPNGIGVPEISALSDDHRRIIVKAVVYEKHLPKDHDELKNALLFTAYRAIGSVASEFDLNTDDKSAHRAVRMEFLSNHSGLKDTPNGVVGFVPSTVYADFTDGELTFH